MLQRAFKEANNAHKWINIVGWIFISPAFAILVTIILAINGWDLSFNRGGVGPNAGAEGFSLILSIMFYALPCLVIGLIFVLISATESAKTPAIEDENDSDRNINLSTRVWRFIGNLCQMLGLLILASWFHLPVYLMYFKELIPAIIPATVLGLILLFVGFMINSIIRIVLSPPDETATR